MILQSLCISACVYMYVHCVCVYCMCFMWRKGSYLCYFSFLLVKSMQSYISCGHSGIKCFCASAKCTPPFRCCLLKRHLGDQDDWCAWNTIATFCNLQPARFSLLGEAKDCVVPWSYKFWRIKKKVKMSKKTWGEGGISEATKVMNTRPSKKKWVLLHKINNFVTPKSPS